MTVRTVEDHTLDVQTVDSHIVADRTVDNRSVFNRKCSSVCANMIGFVKKKKKDVVLTLKNIFSDWPCLNYIKRRI